jgi:hypothetical protein
LLLGRREWSCRVREVPAPQRLLGGGVNGATTTLWDSKQAKAIFDTWLEPLRDLGARRNVIEGIGSTDHVPFHEAGVPAFTAIKEFRNYDVRTRHTNADLSDAVNVEDLKQSAVVLAVVAWHAALREAPLPSPRP